MLIPQEEKGNPTIFVEYVNLMLRNDKTNVSLFVTYGHTN
jgi:hypothetical protein